jgi:hypothetical protein
MPLHAPIPENFDLGIGLVAWGHRVSEPEIVWASKIFNAMEGLTACNGSQLHLY